MSLALAARLFCRVQPVRNQAESQAARHSRGFFSRLVRGPQRSSILLMKVVDGRDQLGAKDLFVAPPLELRVELV